MTEITKARISKARRRARDGRQQFASAAMEAALVAAFKHAFNTRKREEGFTHARLARNSGRHRSAVSKTLSAQDWRLSTLSDFAEALSLRLEFAFVDRKYPQRRFTPDGVEFALVDPSEAGFGS